MSFIESLLQDFAQYKVLVLGDVILDIYMQGDVHRISPEAPVPIVDVKHQEARLGGAANVAMNLQALGAKVLLCSIIGADTAGERLQALARSAGLDTSGLLCDPIRKSTCKTRILSEGHHMLRIDEEIQDPLSTAQSKALQQAIEERLRTCQLLIFQDYDKGVLTAPLITETIAAARRLQVPIAVDPKRRNFFSYAGATLFKPNLKEFEESMHFVWQKGNLEVLQQQATRLREQMQLEEVLITLSEEGMYAQNAQEERHEPAQRRQIVDVSGAGDAVMSVAALCKAQGLSMAKVLALANLAGGWVCETPGVVPITAKALAQQAARWPLFTTP